MRIYLSPRTLHAALNGIFHRSILSITVDRIRCFLSTMFDKKECRKIRILNLELEAHNFGTSTITVTIPFDRNGFTEVVPVKKTDEEKIVKALKLNSRLTTGDIAIIIGKTRKTVMRLLKKSDKIIRAGSDKTDHREIKK